METTNLLSRVKSKFKAKPNVDVEDYDALSNILEDNEGARVRRVVHDEEDVAAERESSEEGVPRTGSPFSKHYYFIFILLGTVMLWAWNMFLAAAPYFMVRFADNEKILANFQAAVTSVGCITNLGSMLILDFFQFKANYPRRIMLSMGVNIVVFTLLAISTQSFTGVSATAYLVFILLMVFITSVATALCQNGAFAFVATFHTPAYISAIMVGQAIAGVLPSVAGIASVLATTPAEISANMEQKLSIENKANTKSALIYFLTATAISAFGLVMFVPLVRKHNKMLKEGMISSTTSLPERTKTSMWKLYRKLYWQASAVAMCFTVTMFFPVFTSKVFSLVPEDKASPIYRPSAFIPLGFLVWNLGDLLGRVSTSIPMFRFRKHPRTLLVLAVARSGFIPLYLLCNIGGKGAVVQSDFFYLFVVQLLYGATSGWLSSLCMLSPGDYIEEGELEAAGTFMATNLVAGLAAGSLLSFAVSKFQGI